MKNLFIVLFLFSIFNYGCGGSEVKSDLWKDPDYGITILETIAILPVQNSKLSKDEAKKIDKYFFNGIYKNNKKFIPAETTFEKLVKDSLEKKYYDLSETYSSTGQQDTKAIKEICAALNCDAVYLGVIYDIKQKNGKFGEYVGETSAAVKYTLFSAQDGKVLLDTFAKAHEDNSTTINEAPPLIEVVEMAMKKIVSRLSKSN